MQDLFGPVHHNAVSFDFTATGTILQVVAPNGKRVPKEVELWLQFFYGSALPSWSRYQVVISREKKLYTHFSDDPESVSVQYTENSLDEKLLSQLHTHIERLDRVTLNGTYSNLSIMDGAGWTLIIFPEKIYIECMNHFPEEPHCMKLIELLKGMYIT